MKIYLDSVGCRLNQSEIETFARQFRAAGHSLVSQAKDADLVVVNTCTVTAAAASDSRQKIRQAARAGAKQVIATGCWATLDPKAAAALPNVCQVIPNLAKDQLVAELLQISPDAIDLEPMQREPLPGAHSRTRAFIKVQDGCDNRCTFCITTVARGPGRSRTVSAVLSDINNALAGGTQEIVLTGVHLGSWGKDLNQPSNLTSLIRSILDKTRMPRLRLSSLEPWEIDEEFLALWKDPRLCPHLHLPLQSGCKATLRRMARNITPAEYTRLVSTARKMIPGVAITTDIIVGFPGEGEAEFNESIDFVKSIGFAGGHVFTYSARAGTAAARMPGQIHHPVRKARNAEMRGILAQASETYRRSFLGQSLAVLWESATLSSPGTWENRGLSGNYLRVSANAARNLWNTITPVKLTGLTEDGLFGELQPTSD
jgi:threonylcarbamoyladenosine tRNA methylthiotransferase MtaB